MRHCLRGAARVSWNPSDTFRKVSDIAGSEYRINREIRAREVRLIVEDEGKDGATVTRNVGVVTLEEAMRIAAEKGVDLVEVSPVVFPADSAARVDLASVKHMDLEALLPECETERDLERLLRDAGLGRRESMALLSKAKAIFIGRDAPKVVDAKTSAAILERLQRLGQ